MVPAPITTIPLEMTKLLIELFPFKLAVPALRCMKLVRLTGPLNVMLREADELVRFKLPFVIAPLKDVEFANAIVRVPAFRSIFPPK